MSKIFERNCDFCGKFYKGSGMFFCSLSCSSSRTHILPCEKKDKEREYRKRHREKHREELKLKSKIYFHEKGGRFKENERKKKKYKESIKYRIDSDWSRVFWGVLKNDIKRKKINKILGYSSLEIRNHFEKQFDDKMTWENYGSYWCIDHIKPKSLFNYETVESIEFKECWALNNLRPLEKSENMRKKNNS